MKPVSKWAGELRDVLGIPRAVAEATTAANTEVFGPSFLSFPIDVMQATVDDAKALAEVDKHQGARGAALPLVDRGSLREVEKLLRRSKRPVAIAGNAIFREGATAELTAFVERFGIPVVSTLASKGVLPPAHPLAVGAINRYLDGILKAPLMDALFGEADLILLLGYDLTEDVKPVHWRRPNRPICPVVLVSQVPNPVADLVKADVTVVSSVKWALSLMAGPEFDGGGLREPPNVIKEIRRLKAESGSSPFQHYPTIPPQLIVKAACKALGPEGILVSDIGLHKQYAALFSDSTRPNTFVCSNGLGSFGFGVAGAMGAQLAHPDKRVLAICGDGGFLSNSQDLETAVRYELPIVLIIMKDSAFGLIKHYQLRGKSRISPPSVDFLNTDFETLAKAHGCHGYTVSSTMRLDKTIEQAFATGEPALIQIPVAYQYRF
jgi:acetolactate synthase-1/2/3 large subunit/N2-(2-carboxyethyl)arginine synthase